MKQIYKRVCPVCGIKFEAKRKNQIYCSKKCKTEFNNDKLSQIKKKNYKPIRCIVCGKLFTPLSSQHKCCCKKCSNKYHNSQAKTRERKILCSDHKLSSLGKINVNRWHRMILSDGTRATNKEPWDAFKCAQTMMVPIAEVERAFAEYDAAIKNGTEREFYRV